VSVETPLCMTIATLSKPLYSEEWNSFSKMFASTLFISVNNILLSNRRYAVEKLEEFKVLIKL